MPIPSTGDGYDGQADGGEAEESFKPLTRAELENRVLDGVKRKELEAQKEGSLYDIEHGKSKEPGHKGVQKQKSKLPIK
jgi:hypothetical protein